MTIESGLNEDFSDLLRELNDNEVQFLLVGAHAMAAHGIPRATGDMDICTGREKDQLDVKLIEQIQGH